MDLTESGTWRRLASLALAGLVVLGAGSALAQVPSTRSTISGDAGPCRLEEQASDATLTGTVSDATGARLADTIVMVECGVIRRESQADRDGRFTLRLRPGTYRLQVVKAGFEPLIQDVRVTADGASVDVSLALGSFADSVTVVSASGAEQSMRDAPASISVVTREDLERRPTRDLIDVLGMVEGITPRRSGNSVPVVQVRGLDSAYTLMLIDGQRVNASAAMFRGNDYDTGWVPAEAIERVEVVRGPMSSLYGSDAIGGVINIITRRVGPRWTGSASATGNLQENRRAGDAYIANFSLTGPLVRERLGLKAYGGYDRRGADATVNPPPPGGAAPLPGFPMNDNRFVAGELGWVLDTRNDLSLRYDTSRRDHGGFVMTRQAGSATHRGKWNAATSELRVYGDRIRNQVGTVTGQINPNLASKIVGDGRLNVPLRAHVLTVGGEFRREALDDPANLAGWPGTPDFGRVSTIAIRQSAVFAELDLGLGPAVRVTLGNRFDHHQNFGGNNSPRAYVVYHPAPSLTLKGGVARAFRAPTLLQNSPNWGAPSCGNATTGCFIIGSLELDPETSTSVEGSVQFDRGVWSAGVTAFQNDLDNMIDITNRTNDPAIAPTYPNFVGFLPPGAPGFGRAIFRYQNINAVRTRGVEATARATVSPAVTLRVNYGYLEAENLSGATPLPLIYRPAHSVNGIVDWRPTASLSISGTVRTVSRQYINVPANGLNLVARDGYGIADLSAAYRFDEHVTVRGGFLNLSNTTLDRQSTLDFNEDGRRYFVTLSTRF